MEYTVSRDCSISVTVRRENTKKFTVKGEGRNTVYKYSKNYRLLKYQKFSVYWFSDSPPPTI